MNKFPDFKLVTAVTKCLQTLGNRELPFSVCDCEKVVGVVRNLVGKFAPCIHI